MKRSKKKVATMIVSIGLVLSLGLAGCSKATDSKKEETTTSPAAMVESSNPAPTVDSSNVNKDHLEISLSFFEIGKYFQNSSSDDLVKTMEQKFNVTFKPMQVSWDDFSQKFQVWAASGQLPDIFSPDVAVDNPGVYNSWIKNGTVKALPDDLSKYPNLAKVMSLPDVQPVKVNGKYYAIPRMTYPTNDMTSGDGQILIRKDWMEKLKLSAPKSFDDLIQIGKAFATKDPDGNNKQDTIGIAGNTFGYLSLLELPVLPQFNSYSWLIEDGKWIPYYASKKMDQVVQQYRTLYTSGALDRDFATRKNDTRDLFEQGKIGVLVFSSYPGHLYDVASKWTKYNPDVKFTDAVGVLPMWPSAEGVTYRHTVSTWWSESMFSSKVDDQKMDRILQIYEYLKSADGQNLFSYGIEGKDYKKEGDKIVVTRANDPKTGQPVSLMEKYPSMNVFASLAGWDQDRNYQDTETNRANFGADVLKMGIDNLDNVLKTTTPVPVNWQVNAIDTPAKQKMQKIKFEDDLTKVILSKQDPVQMWHDIVKGYNDLGLQQAIDEVNAEAVKLGIK